MHDLGGTWSEWMEIGNAVPAHYTWSHNIYVKVTAGGE